jgi:hypothetical protein
LVDSLALLFSPITRGEAGAAPPVRRSPYVTDVTGRSGPGPVRRSAGIAAGTP